MKKIALIVAGGSGTRMRAGIPKQFLEIRGCPVLMHTLKAFYRYDPDIRLIVILPEEQITTWRELCLKHSFEISHQTGPGGETRFHSVQKNLRTLPDHCLVAIHDGVRPLVSGETLDRCFKTAAQYGNAVPCVEIPESMRRVSLENSQPVDRALYRLIQTPQVFESLVLKKAYERPYRPEFTDDASVVESMGKKIHLVQGNPENIKITFKNDLPVAEALLEKINTTYRSANRK